MPVPEHTVRPQSQKCFFLNIIHTVYTTAAVLMILHDSPSLVATSLKCLTGN